MLDWPTTNKTMLSYSDHYETLVALVTHLAVVSSDGRDASNAPRLAAHLGLDIDEVIFVLDNYKGIFRRTQETFPSSYGQQHRYALQLRYARRKYVDGRIAEVSEPLSNEDLFALLTFITNKVQEEQANYRLLRSNRITIIGVWIAATMSLISTVLVILK